MSLRFVVILSLVTAPTVGQTGERVTRAQPATPSLVELARKERARRQAITQPVRVITNADLKQLGDARVTTSHSASGWARLPQKTEVSEPITTESEGPTREELAAAFAEARLNYQNAVNNNLVLQLRINNLRNAFATADDGSRSGMIQAELQEALVMLDTSEEQIQTARQAISDLENEAAAAGLLPGEIEALVGVLPEPSSMLADSNPTP